MFSQILVTLINEDSKIHVDLMEKLDTASLAVFKVILTEYGFWNLDYFRYFIPPFCVSQELKNIHVLALQCVSAFYPLLLIVLVLNYMGTTSDQLSGYGNHFTDVVLMLEEGGTPKEQKLLSLLHFFCWLTVSFCLCHCIC